MKLAYLISLILILILLIAVAASINYYAQTNNNLKSPVYVGVAFGGNTTAQAKLLIDKVKDYTNLFVLASGLNPISANESAVREICDYATKNGLSIILSLGTYTNEADWQWKMQFFNDAKSLYGNKFLGTYYDDDIGGFFLDWNWTQQFNGNQTLQWSEAQKSTLKPLYDQIRTEFLARNQPTNYSLESKLYQTFRETNTGFVPLKNDKIKTFTSDYCLYWFDYLGGYDTMFVQLGWNESINQEISLTRGAATMQNKDWGAIITWKYMQPPYLDSGLNVYSQMQTAYNDGAKYITIFDFPYNDSTNPYGSLTESHFQALQAFWSQDLTKQKASTPHADVALVLPKDYGWGMRNPSDRIWGYWGPDDKSPQIWNISRQLLSQYGPRLDIVYDDPAFPIQGNYTKIYFWNQTI